MVGKERWGNMDWSEEIWVLLLGVAESCRPFIKICFSVIEAMARQVLVFSPNQQYQLSNHPFLQVRNEPIQVLPCSKGRFLSLLIKLGPAEKTCH